MNTQPLTSSQGPGTAFLQPSPPHEPHFLVRGMPIASGPLLLQPLGTASFICTFQSVCCLSLAAHKHAAPFLKASPCREPAFATGTSVLYGNNTTFQDAVLVVLFSPIMRSWGKSNQTLWMRNSDCLSDTSKCNSLASNEGFLWLHMFCASLNKPTSRFATLAF